MNSSLRQRRKPAPPRHTAPGQSTGWSKSVSTDSIAWGIVLATLIWFTAATSIASRVHLVMGYATVPAGPPTLELFLASWSTWLFTTTLAVIWLVVALRRLYGAEHDAPRDWKAWAAWAVAGSVPLLANLLRSSGVQLAPNYWEPLWLSAFSGLSCGLLARHLGSPHRRSTLRVESTSLESALGDISTRRVERRWGERRWGERRWLELCVVTISWLALAGWWYLQSKDYYANYLLGFNDFGHFAQRLANTATGRGLLLETPVLPMFWDHFNPGLMLLAPLWKLFPSVHFIFVLQALSLSVGGLLVWGIARQLDFDRLSALCMGLAWLAQPVLGQMNLAYTYGWHPISLAIPLMLAAVWSLLAKHRWWALLFTLSAMSMEEGVIVVVALFCAGCAAQRLLIPTPLFSRQETATQNVLGLSATTWSIAAAISILTFLLVYRYSGIAEFQTGRFVALGNSAGEVLLSPVLRPGAFWGAIFRWDKMAFCLSMWLPCFIPGLLRGWRWMLPTALPLLVLIVWDHKPATSLAFQYSSTLLPIFWLAAIVGGRHAPRMSSISALTTGLVLSLYVGQMPYSSPTLLDVIGHTYGIQENENEQLLLRKATDPDGLWLSSQVSQIRQQGGPVLSTGRVAAHLVGNSDVETVGQYLERRERLSQIPDRMGAPIKHYRWIVLDNREGFQQTPANITAVKSEALQAGFRITSEQYDIVVLEPSPVE